LRLLYKELRLPSSAAFIVHLH